MTHASLFSGIGGFDLAAHWAGIENVFVVEKELFPQQILIKRFPNAKLYKDIYDFDGKEYKGKIDIISGGFPCQPFSTAGKRDGIKDDRYLWPEMFRVIQEIQPKWIVAENVRGITSIANGDVFEEICANMESVNYQVQPFIIPAKAVGAPHKRERVWFIANRNDNQQEQWKCNKTRGRCSSESRQIDGIRTGAGSEDGDSSKRVGFVGGSSEGIYAENTTDTDCRRLEGTEEEKCTCEHALRSNIGITDFTADTDNGSRYKNPLQTGWKINEMCDRGDWSEKWIEALTRIYGVDDGISRGMDRLEQRYKDKSRKNRIKACGNAIVPQIAYVLFKTILEVEKGNI